MCKIDLKDAYCSVSINKRHKKYLRFVWEGRLYKYFYLGFDSLTQLIWYSQNY